MCYSFCWPFQYLTTKFIQLLLIPICLLCTSSNWISICDTSGCTVWDRFKLNAWHLNVVYTTLLIQRFSKNAQSTCTTLDAISDLGVAFSLFAYLLEFSCALLQSCRTISVQSLWTIKRHKWKLNLNRLTTFSYNKFSCTVQRGFSAKLQISAQKKKINQNISLVQACVAC